MVSDVNNGILVKSNMLGETMYYGSGAGKLPTASAVVADIIDAAKHANRNVVMGWSSQKQEMAPMETNTFRYFIRVAGLPEEQIDGLMNFGPEEGDYPGGKRRIRHHF